MNTVNTIDSVMYDSIEIGDTIIFPNSFLAIKQGRVIGFKGINGSSKYVLCEDGVFFPISKWDCNYVLWSE